MPPMLKQTLCAIAIFLSCANPVFAYELTGDPTLGFISPSEDAKMGQQYFQAIQQQEVLLTDPIVNQYIKTLGARLAKAADDPQQQFHFFVVEDDEINSFTGPGGYIGVDTGLINIVHNEGELAAVLAHEIGHVKQRHIARTIQHDDELRIPEIAITAAAAAIGMQSPDAGAGAIAATMAGSEQNAIHFTREDEQEADRIGLGILYKAGFDPQSMPQMFALLQKIDELYPDDIPAYLQDHPLDDQRIANTEDLVSEYPKQTYQENPDFPLILARVRAETATDPLALQQYYRVKLLAEPTNAADQYGYALSLMCLNHYAAALTYLNNLLQAQPKNLIFLLTYADIQSQLNQNSAAENTLKQAYALNQHYYPTNLYYANVLVRNNDPSALSFIQQQIKAYPQDAQLYYLLADTQAKAGNNLASHQTLAQYMQIQGDTQGAIEQLQIALNNVGISYADKQKIKAKIKALQAE